MMTKGSELQFERRLQALVSMKSKKPQMDLQRKLEAEGWKVRVVKNYNNCYEVYGFTGKGEKVEAFFHPKSFERIYPEGETPAK